MATPFTRILRVLASEQRCNLVVKKLSLWRRADSETRELVWSSKAQSSELGGLLRNRQWGLYSGTDVTQAQRCGIARGSVFCLVSVARSSDSARAAVGRRCGACTAWRCVEMRGKTGLHISHALLPIRIEGCRLFQSYASVLRA